MNDISRYLKEPRETLALKLITIEEILSDPMAGYGLTPRQSEIAFFLARGYKVSEIGRVLDIANSTVQTTIKRICKKVKVKPREFPRVMARSIEAVLETRLSHPIPRGLNQCRLCHGLGGYHLPTCPTFVGLEAPDV